VTSPWRTQAKRAQRGCRTDPGDAHLCHGASHRQFNVPTEVDDARDGEERNREIATQARALEHAEERPRQIEAGPAPEGLESMESDETEAIGTGNGYGGS
jgi:hypothetical protein